jgi:hypothetical protein
VCVVVETKAWYDETNDKTITVFLLNRMPKGLFFIKRV